MKLRPKIRMIDLTRSLSSLQDSLTPPPTAEKSLWQIALEVLVLAAMGYAITVLTLA